jgi:hypothetical protein
VPPIPGIQAVGYLTSDTLWNLRELPRRLVVLGGGPIGSEMTQAFDFFTTKEVTLYRGKGCSACNHTGYKGRLGIYEFIMGTPELQTLILNHPSAQQIWEVARNQGSTSLFEDGLEKVWSGITTIDELLRVAAPPRKKIPT